MITPSYALTATERVLPKLALDFTTASLDPRITFTRATGASNPATFINSSGVITTATNNQPRFDYDPVTLVCKGLLIEESRTNVLLNSDTLSTQSVTVTAAARTLSFYGTGQVVLSGAHSATVTGTGAYPTRTTLTFTPSAGTLTLTVTGTVQYAQLEAGAFATSYIPTTTTALTRNADVAVMTGTNFSDWFNASEGTLYAQGSRFGTSNVFPRLAQCDDGTDNSIINVFVNSSANTGGGSVAVSGATSASYSGFNVGGTNATGKVALAYKQDSFGFAANSTGGTPDTLGNLPTVNSLILGARRSGPAYLNGHIQKIQYWSIRLTQSELNAFTK